MQMVESATDEEGEQAALAKKRECEESIEPLRKQHDEQQRQIEEIEHQLGAPNHRRCAMYTRPVRRRAALALAGACARQVSADRHSGRYTESLRRHEMEAKQAAQASRACSSARAAGRGFSGSGCRGHGPARRGAGRRRASPRGSSSCDLLHLGTRLHFGAVGGRGGPEHPDSGFVFKSVNIARPSRAGRTRASADCNSAPCKPSCCAGCRPRPTARSPADGNPRCLCRRYPFLAYTRRW